jgi:predicted permease
VNGGDGVRAKADDAAAEVRAELEAHFAGSVEMLMARGWTESAARAEVRRRFGDERRYRAELERAARRRSVRRRLIETWRTFICALAAAFRGVRRSPGLSVAVVITLALGLGANAAIFRVVDRLLLSPPPHIVEPEEVRQLYRTLLRDDGETSTVGLFSYAEVQSVRDAAPEVRVAATMRYASETVGSGAAAVRLNVARVDAEYFPVLGVRPVLGRGLLPEDHATGADVVVLSHDAWVTHFGGDDAVLGRRIRVAAGAFEIVGIMPRGFHGSHMSGADLWVPLEADVAALLGDDWRVSADAYGFTILARVPPSARHAWEQRVTSVLRDSESIARLRARLLSATTTSLVPGDAPNPAATISVSRWLAGVSLLVLLVACANAANLFLAHAERHRRETAVRLALGAGAGALRTELLARALCLALLGAAAALLFAIWGARVLDMLFATGIEPVARPGTTRLLVFTGVLGILAALLAGLLPALRLPRFDVRRTLEGGGRVAGRAGFARRTLASVQVALCMVLLTGAGLFVVSFRNAARVDLGFTPDRLIVLRMEHDGDMDAASASRLLDDARERVLRVPGVESASRTVAVPFDLMYGLSASLPDGDPIADLRVNAVGEDYFRTMGLQVERGRAIDARDVRQGAEPVVVVSRRAAARLWPALDPLAQCLHIGSEGPCARIVGVAGEHAGASVMQEIAPPRGMQAWVANGYPGTQPASALLVRTAGPAARLQDDVRRAALVPGVRYIETELMSDIVAGMTGSWRLGATVFSLFGLVALLVAGLGLYGVLSFEVAQRLREFGIRAALGADRLRVVLPVVRFAAPVVIAGVGAGALIALLVAGRLGGLLFEIGPRDPIVLGAAAAGVIVVAIAALLPPAWRAAHVDPRESLTDGS